MKEVVIVGIGNKLMMDDGIGVSVVELMYKQNTHPELKYIAGETDVDFCVNQIENASDVIIIDAAYLGLEPGELGVYPINNVLNNKIRPINAHEADILYDISLNGQHQNNSTITNETLKGLFIGIEPAEIGYSMGLSKTLKESFENIIVAVEKIINDYIIKTN